MAGAKTTEQELLSPGDHDVDSPVVCVLTRFAVRRPWQSIQMYLAYRWLMRQVRRTAPSGLLKACFLVENRTTCYSLSLWADESAIPNFGTCVQEHVTVAGSVFGWLRFTGARPELWSTKWRLYRVSNNLTWKGFDLRQILLREEMRA